jgi:hypothetical protein
LLYIPVALYKDLIPSSQLKQTQNDTITYNCGFSSSNDIQFYISLYDFINIVGLPFLLMLIFSSLLILAIFQSRNRLMRNIAEQRNFKQDIWFSVTSLSLNIIFLILNLPLSIINFSTSFSNFEFRLCLYIFFCNYAINFYVILFTNSMVRKELTTMFSKADTQN